MEISIQQVVIMWWWTGFGAIQENWYFCSETFWKKSKKSKMAPLWGIKIYILPSCHSCLSVYIDVSCIYKDNISNIETRLLTKVIKLRKTMYRLTRWENLKPLPKVGLLQKLKKKRKTRDRIADFGENAKPRPNAGYKKAIKVRYILVDQVKNTYPIINPYYVRNRFWHNPYYYGIMFASFWDFDRYNFGHSPH